VIRANPDFREPSTEVASLKQLFVRGVQINAVRINGYDRGRMQYTRAKRETKGVGTPNTKKKKEEEQKKSNSDIRQKTLKETSDNRSRQKKQSKKI
jgi:hypothetical protein